jgi:hypothetical protein
MSPRFVQLSHGCPRLHFNLLSSLARANLMERLAARRRTWGHYFLCRHGPHDSGTLLRFRTTRYWPSGEAPLEEVVEGGVGVMLFECGSGRTDPGIAKRQSPREYGWEVDLRLEVGLPAKQYGMPRKVKTRSR